MLRHVLSCSSMFHSVCPFPYWAVLLALTETGATMYISIYEHKVTRGVPHGFFPHSPCVRSDKRESKEFLV